LSANAKAPRRTVRAEKIQGMLETPTSFEEEAHRLPG
tara:strand:+ start:171 stop:281 length:111 start_codon:yes stop_codon:yes gene_type:complete